MDITCYSSARDMLAALRARDVSARELLDLHLRRVDQVNDVVNAVVSLDPDRSRARAHDVDQAVAAGRPPGPLAGLPFAVKDTHAVAGWRTTYGSPLFADFVPERDDLVVERVRRAGAVIVGKTNVPEWAAGSHTFNPVFGLTRNPYDPARSAGGSSGGAAAALASGMVPLADGSDMGGSLRNPASFCNVVGLRPSFGRVPEWPVANAFDPSSVPGPLARTVGDLALLLSVLAGPEPRVPLALGDPGETFAEVPHRSLEGLRVALSIDLGGLFTVDTRVADVVRWAGDRLAGEGALVIEDAPDLAEAEDTFRTLRAWSFWHKFAGMLRDHPEGFKESLADNIRAGERLSGEDVARAYDQRTRLSERTREFFDRYDVLALPVSQVPPFDAGEEYPSSINGEPQTTYLDWMRSAYLVTVTGCPAMSVPAGFTPEGWPVGLQLVAAPNAERHLLGVAAAVERLTGAAERRPDLPAPA